MNLAPSWAAKARPLVKTVVHFLSLIAALGCLVCGFLEAFVSHEWGKGCFFLIMFLISKVYDE